MDTKEEGLEIGKEVIFVEKKLQITFREIYLGLGK